MQEHVWSGILEFFMKHIFERDFLKVLESSKDMIIKAYSISKDDALFCLRIILYYNIKKITEEEGSSLKQVLNNITEHKGEEVMASLAHVWEQKGREEGLAKGIEKGILEEKRVIARKMLARGVQVQEIAEWTGLTVKDITNLSETDRDK